MSDNQLDGDDMIMNYRSRSGKWESTASYTAITIILEGT